MNRNVKRAATALILVLAIAMALSGCGEDDKETDLTISLKNSTGYDLEQISLNIPGTRPNGNPMFYPRFENGILAQDETQTFKITVLEKSVGSSGFVNVHLVDDSTVYNTNPLPMTENCRLIIACDEEMNFTLSQAPGINP